MKGMSAKNKSCGGMQMHVGSLRSLYRVDQLVQERAPGFVFEPMGILMDIHLCKGQRAAPTATYAHTTLWPFQPIENYIKAPLLSTCLDYLPQSDVDALATKTPLRNGIHDEVLAPSVVNILMKHNGA
eukprot:2174892-Amphidinium_carterae.1